MKLVVVFFLWPCCEACGILIPQLVVKPMPSAVEAQSLNHWTTREVPEVGAVLTVILQIR